jgi:hypothetical protein
MSLGMEVEGGRDAAAGISDRRSNLSSGILALKIGPAVASLTPNRIALLIHQQCFSLT